MPAFTNVANYASGGAVLSVDWSPTNNLIAMATTNWAGSAEYQTLRFLSTSLVQVSSQDYGLSIAAHSVRFHPTSNLVAIATSADGSAGEIRFVTLNPTNGTIIQSNRSIEVGAAVVGLSWRVSGGSNYLAATTLESTNNLTIFSYAGTTELAHATRKLVGAGPTEYPIPNAVAWRPSSTQLLVGVEAASSNELVIMGFSSTNLSQNSALNYSIENLRTLSWHPGGQLFAVGLFNIGATNEQNLRLYTTGVLSAIGEVTNARIGEYRDVTALDWSPSGDLLAVARLNTNRNLNLYRYDWTNRILIPVGEQLHSASATRINALRWSPDGRYIALGDNSSAVTVYRLMSANLGLTKTGTPYAAVPGSNLIYQLRLTNAGPDTAHGITLVDTLATNVNPLTAVATADGDCVISGRYVTCTFSNLPAMTSALVTITVQVPANIPGTLTNRVDVGAITPDPVSTNNVAIYFSPRDWDGDGVADGPDNCDTVANPGQEDADGDGVGDACDNCPTNHNPAQANFDGDAWGDACDGCPTNSNFSSSDLDGDGIWDECDLCPTNPAVINVDSDGDGFGDPCDNCPAIYNPDQADYDGDGIGNLCDEDADGDGMPNWWEEAHGFNPLEDSNVLPDGPLNDWDGDGLLNYEEYVYGTDATNTASYFRYYSPTGALPAVTFVSSTGRFYDIWVSTNLPAHQWSSWRTNLPGSNVTMTITDTNQLPLRNYRLRVRAP